MGIGAGFRMNLDNGTETQGPKRGMSREREDEFRERPAAIAMAGMPLSREESLCRKRGIAGAVDLHDAAGQARDPRRRCTGVAGRMRMQPPRNEDCTC